MRVYFFCIKSMNMNIDKMSNKIFMIYKISNYCFKRNQFDSLAELFVIGLHTDQ